MWLSYESTILIALLKMSNQRRFKNEAFKGSTYGSV